MRSILTITFFMTLCFAEAEWQHFPGIVVLQTGDSLRGEVLLYELSGNAMHGTSYLMKNHKIGFVDKYVGIDSEQKARWIEYDKISSVRISDDKLIAGGKFELYKNLNYENTLWRLRKQKNSVAIYDNSIFQYDVLKIAPPKMILISNGQVTDMYSTGGGFLHDNKIRSLLLRFINDRYKKAFKKSDFKTDDDLVDYILTHG
jgi:hypothetical protein